MCIYSLEEWTRWYPNIFDKLSKSDTKLCIQVISKLDGLISMTNSIFIYRGFQDCGKPHDEMENEVTKRAIDVPLDVIAERKKNQTICLLAGCSMDIVDFYSGDVGFCKLGNEPEDCYGVLILLSMKKRESLGEIIKVFENATVGDRAECGSFVTHKFDENDYVLYNKDVDRKRIDAFWKEHHGDNP